MMRLLVIGDKAKLTPLLRQKLVSEAEKDNPRIEIGRFAFLAENVADGLFFFGFNQRVGIDIAEPKLFGKRLPHLRFSRSHKAD